MNRNDKDCKPLNLVRGVGFDNYFGIVDGKVKNKETMFFVDGNGNNSYKATPAAVREAIDYLQRQVNVMKDYLDNDCNNNTGEWKIRRVV